MPEVSLCGATVVPASHVRVSTMLLLLIVESQNMRHWDAHKGILFTARLIKIGQLVQKLNQKRTHARTHTVHFYINVFNLLYKINI
jgi:hypothetical protein